VVTFIVRRLIAAVFLLIVVSIVIFAIFFWLPRLGGQTTYGLAAPHDLLAKYDLAKAQVDVHAKCAPGMRRCRIEIASDQAMTTNLKQFPGDGARQTTAGLPAGTWWIRAAHVRAAELSSYTGPIAVIVK